MKKSLTRRKNLSHPIGAGVQQRPWGREAREREAAKAYRKLGSVIQGLREKKGLTKKQLAERCRFSTRRVQRIEKGEATLRFSELTILAEGLETPLFDMLQSAGV